MPKQLYYYFLSFVFLFTSCKKEENPPDTEEQSYNIVGNVQKGPFANGSNITLYELNNQVSPTGRSFHATTGIQGQFDLMDITLVSPYIELIADGFYYNEILGSLSGERISLKAIADLSEQETININVLTNLEYERVKQLIENKGITIQDAKNEAQNELLSVFSLDSFTIDYFETLNIIQSGEGDAILLAISAILQGNHTTAELSNLLADIVTDMKEDGILNDTTIQNTLLGQALTINCDQIEINLMEKYSELGIVLDGINNFEEYVNYFITHSPYHVSTPFEFPESTENRLNVLDPERLEFQMMTDYAFAVDMPGTGKITIKMHRTSGMGGWWYSPSEAYGWNVSDYNFTAEEQIFTSTLNGVVIDLPIEFSEYGSALVEYYYNASETPALSKTITWGAEINDTADFIFPDDSPAGPNLLNIADSLVIESETSYTVGLQKPGGWIIDFILTYANGIDIEVTNGYGIYTFEETEGQLNFTLAGPNEGLYRSEIAITITGEGEIQLVSDDLEIEEGVLLDRTYFIN